MSAPAAVPERKLTIGLMFAVCVQLAAGFIWAGSIAARIEALERSSNTYQADHVLLARLETRVEAIGDQLDRIEARLEVEP
ncbi:MAG: hypothetical protein AAFO88_11360 [Pseudomonadota bacterium]